MNRFNNHRERIRAMIPDDIELYRDTSLLEIERQAQEKMTRIVRVGEQLMRYHLSIVAAEHVLIGRRVQQVMDITALTQVELAHLGHTTRSQSLVLTLDGENAVTARVVGGTVNWRRQV